MKVSDLITLLDAENLTPSLSGDREISCGYACDLLSWVMAHGKPGMAWITVQTHMNVVAVATLHDMACVIIPEGASVPDEVWKKAEEEGIAMLTSEKGAYELSGLLYSAGLAGK